MPKQTAIDYLIKELSAILGPLETKPMQDLLVVDAINKAKQMEKEQQFNINDVMLSLPTVKEIEAWAKEQAKIEPTGAEEFGRIWGAIWMLGLIAGKLKVNGA